MEQKEINIIGYHAAIGALQNSNRRIISLRCTREFYNRNRILIEKRKIKNFEIVSRKIIDSQAKNNFHQGVFIKCENLEKLNLDSISPNEKNLIILDSLNDSQNVGSIIRTAFLFGIKTIIFNKDNSFEINQFLIKAASGAFEKIKIIEVTNINRTLESLKKKGFWSLGLDTKSKNNLESIPKDIKKVIIFGSEGKGIRPLIIKNCDFTARIDLPVRDQFIDSLNVSNSVCLVLYKFM